MVALLTACTLGAPLGGGQLNGQAQVPAATATAAAISVTAPAGSTEAAIQQLILQGNSEQERAIAGRDASVMKDTSTDNYYQTLVQANQDLLDSGATTIKLVKLTWGPIAVAGTTANATTYETWTTDYADGTTDESTDRNVYSLLQQNSGWLIAADDHPDAGASSPPGQTQPASSAPASRPTPVTQVPPAAISPEGESSNWSGYFATGGTFTAVSATWVIPQPSASSTSGVDAAWVGIGGVSSHDLIQAGTQETELSTGYTQYQSWTEILPQASETVPLAVHAGDSVTVSISQSAAGPWLITVGNNATGKSYQTQTEYASSLSSAEWVEEAPSGGRTVLPLDNFGSITFTNGSTVKNSKSVNLQQANAQPITMINGNKQPLATPSVLSADGAGFTVTRTANTSTGFGRGFRGYPSSQRSRS